MNIKNLERAKEIAEQLPALEQARSLLSQQNTYIQVVGEPKQGCSQPTRVTLPHITNYNVVTVLNAEINRLKEEAKGL